MAETMANRESDAQESRRFWPGLGRVIDYMFGRNALIGLASLMLLTISGYATWSGMNDFIVGVSTSPANQGREIVGGLSVSNSLLVVAIVVALTFLMWLALRETFASGRRMTDRFVTLPLYLFLALWSVGFGYGFWWSLIAGEEATRKGLSGLQEDARDAGQIIAARLEAVKVQLDSVVQWSDGQMAREENSGGSCGVPSGAGRGPLYNARRSVRDSVTSLLGSITTAWLEPVKADLEKLRQTASALSGSTVAERQKNFEAMARTIRGSARNIAARSNQLGQSTAAEMRSLAAAVSVKPGQPGFSCYDPTLAQRLTQAANQAAAPAVLDLRPAAFNEGPAGVANAVKNLWSNVGSSISWGVHRLSGSPSATASDTAREPISGRDLIALLATLGIDLGLFALTVLNPPRTPPNRDIPGPLKRQIINAIQTAIRRAPNANWEWIRQHFLHHKSASYLVIPNVYSCDSGRPGEQERALAMNQLAGVLEDMRLVKAMTGMQLRHLGRDEQRASYTDLTPYREKWHAQQGRERKMDSERTRNHGLFSKAERALEIASWSERARSDVEVFRLVDREGLTPLLAVLSEPGDQLIGGASTGGTGQSPSNVPLLPRPETRKRYLEALCPGAGVPVEAVSVLERIVQANADIEVALHAFYDQWPVVSSHLHREQPRVAREVSQSGEALSKAWIKDDATIYPITELPATELETATVTYWVLATIRDDVTRAALGEAAAGGTEQRTAEIRAAVGQISQFLDPGSGMDARVAIEALERLAALAGGSVSAAAGA